MFKGNKISLHKHYSNAISDFYFTLLYDLEDEDFYFLNSFFFYNLIKELIEKKKILLNFNELFFFSISSYDSLFTLKTKKLNKIMRLKLKKKYKSSINYIFKNKRISETLKLLKQQLIDFKRFKLDVRFFSLFLFFILHPSNSLPFRQRNIVYNKLLSTFN